MNVSVGDKVLVPEYGGTKLTFEEKVLKQKNIYTPPKYNIYLCFFLVNCRTIIYSEMVTF